ncbi:MAG: hypothetical protein CBC40_04475 [bacterium TMED80]|nr:MAG: hypothetical protein CBC40_04475 [bacterium TMED80]|tara:strand:+ start:8620 stop:9723 length:1104 start_codon:yes stop_codon:yes gene_type:complete
MRFSNSNILKIKPYKVSSPKAWIHVGDDNVLKLDWNESTIRPSPKVYERIKQIFSERKWNWYPDIENTVLKKSIAKYCNVMEKNIQYFASSDSLHEHIVRAFVSTNDKILTVSPTYDNFRAVAEANNAEVIFFSLDKPNFKLNFKAFEKQLSELNPKIVYVVNPNNPTGTLHEKSKFEKIIKKFNNILFIFDEAYYEFSEKTFSDYIIKNDNVIISRTFSKAFGLASFRIGYMISNEDIIETINKIRNPKNISLFAQEAANAALQDIKYVKEYVNSVNRNKKSFFNYLNNLTWVKPIYGSGNFIFMKVDTEYKNNFIKFLENKKIYIRDYSHINSTKDYVRITIGTATQMKRVELVIDQFQKYMQKL